MSNGGKFKLYTVLNDLIFYLNAQYLLLKFNLKIVVEESIVNASRITD
jgi:hypothetical protein